MTPFDVPWLRWLLVMVLAGLGITVILFLGFYLDARAQPRPEKEEEAEEFPADIRMARRPIPVVLIVLYAGMAIFMIAYVLFTWLHRVSY